MSAPADPTAAGADESELVNDLLSAADHYAQRAARLRALAAELPTLRAAAATGAGLRARFTTMRTEAIRNRIAYLRAIGWTYDEANREVENDPTFVPLDPARRAGAGGANDKEASSE